MNDFIPVNVPLLKGNEKRYLEECIDTGWVSSEGPFVKRFEQEFASRMGRKHGIAVTNGTAAIDAAVEALGIGAGDEVILPAFTIISCVLQIVRSGATPVLVDSDPDTWNMDTAEIESKITQKTKAIIVVHIYGLPVDMKPIFKLCSKYNLRLLEDAAEMIGQTYYDEPCGSFGDISTVSFYPNKHITTGEGGMILTDSDELADQCRELRNLCFKAGRRFVHERMGWNFRMTNFQAAVGVAQLEQLDDFLIKKRWIGEKYNDLLSDIPNVKFPLTKTEYAENIYWVYGLVLDNTVTDNVESIISKLAKKGVGSRPFFTPLHLQPIFKQMGFFDKDDYPTAENLCNRGFYIPSGLALEEKQILKVAEVIREVLITELD